MQKKRIMRLFYLAVVIIVSLGFKTIKDTPVGQNEIFDFKKVKLNDKIFFETTVENLKRVLGKPDSIVTTRHECGAGDAYEHEYMATYYFKKSTFLTFDDKAFMEKISFQVSDFQLSDGRVTLTKGTKLKDLQAYFPQSVKESLDRKDFRDNITYRLVRISPQEGYDDLWVLRFKDQKLIDIEYWIPC